MARAVSIASVVLAATAVTVAVTGRADAQPEPPPGGGYRMPVSPPPMPQRKLSVTISPLHLLFPVLEGTIEARLGPKLGAAGIVGFGSISAETGDGTKQRFVAAEVGASVRHYAWGSFQRGVQVGAEVLYLHLQLDDNQSAQLTGAGAGLTLGPFVGYKWIGRSGFTFDGQLGLAFAVITANSSDGTTSASASDNRVFPLLNVNVGWSL